MISGRLLLTPKGQDELVQNTHKFNLKKRSVLLLLKSSHQDTITFANLAKKGVLPVGELQPVLEELIKEAFVRVEDAAASAATAAAPVEMVPALFDEAVNLIEARFLLNDFCLDVYKTAAPKYIQALAVCKSASELNAFVSELQKNIAATHPRSVQALALVIQEIKATAH